MKNKEHYISNFEKLVDALVAAACTLHDTPDLVDRNAIVLALCDFDIWPDAIREDAA